MSSSPPARLGGQALVEGVMIQGHAAWAMAVRCPDGRIAVETHPLLTTAGWRTRPLLRGPALLARQLRHGWRALNASIQYSSLGERRQEPRWLFALQLTVALAVVSVVFVSLPMLLTERTHADVGWAYRLAEGVLRSLLFVAYVVLITRLPQLRRIFSYHGAEHMAVHAHEAGDPLTVESVRRFSAAHPRCGTAFLLILLMLDTLLLAALPRFGLVPDLALRLAALPLVAGAAYEVLRWGAARQGTGALLTRIGLFSQRLTTACPDDGQIEVAIAAIEAYRAGQATVVQPLAGTPVPAVVPIAWAEGAQSSTR